MVMISFNRSIISVPGNVFFVPFESDISRRFTLGDQEALKFSFYITFLLRKDSIYQTKEIQRAFVDQLYFLTTRHTGMLGLPRKPPNLPLVKSLIAV